MNKLVGLKSGFCWQHLFDRRVVVERLELNRAAVVLGLIAAELAVFDFVDFGVIAASVVDVTLFDIVPLVLEPSTFVGDRDNLVKSVKLQYIVVEKLDLKH